jgi:thiamine kinase-like enzyme
MTDSIKKIGIDLDNTIISYDTAFQLAAKKLKLFECDKILCKENLRNTIRRRKNGEEQWQKLQGYVYGKGIENAQIYPGVQRFLWRCNQLGINVEIVSHKTKYGHFDKSKTLLRECANIFLGNNFIGSSFSAINKITYTDNREDKLDYIRNNRFDLFIDDLVEVVESISTTDCQSILFSSGEVIGRLQDVKVMKSWAEIESFLFGNLTLPEVKLLAESVIEKGSVENVIQLKGRGNSPVYKVLTFDSPMFLKIYPQESKHNRISSEYDSVKILTKLGMSGIQRPIACSKELGVAVYKWIDVDNSYTFDICTVESSLNFLRKLHGSRDNHMFDDFSMASDACTSIYDIEKQIKRRLSQLNEATAEFESLNIFLNNEFNPLFNEIILWSKSHFSIDGDYYKSIGKQEMTLSPSDFGFHNILSSKDDGLKFIDFEYFGRDDPVKLISDFSHHAAMNLTSTMEQLWFQGVKDIYGSSILSRLKVSWPLHGLNWCLIILNEFKSDVWSKRCLANQEIKHNREDILLGQLTKSRNKLKCISECYKNKEFW